MSLSTDRQSKPGFDDGHDVTKKRISLVHFSSGNPSFLYGFRDSSARGVRQDVWGVNFPQLLLVLLLAPKSFSTVSMFGLVHQSGGCELMGEIAFLEQKGFRFG